jgi:hypothetical protein
MKTKRSTLYLFLMLTFSCQQKLQDSNFKAWTFSDQNVFGVLELEKIKGQAYYQIDNQDSVTYKIEEYKANGSLKSSIIIKKRGGKIASLTGYNKQGFATWTQFYQPVEGGLKGISKQLGIKNNMPCKEIIHKFENGMIVESNLIGFDQKPCNCSQGFSTIKYVKYSDENRKGLIKEVSYFNTLGEPVNYGAYHKAKYERDQRGNVIKESYWDVENKATNDSYGVHERRRKFDKFDHEIEMSCHGPDGSAIANIYSVHKYICEYENGLVSKHTNYNVNNQVVKESGDFVEDGSAMRTYKYDKKGALIEYADFDENKKPMNSKKGYHLVKIHFDEFSEVAEKAFFGTNGEPLTDDKGVHKYAYIYDKNGLLALESYYNSENKPMIDASYVYMNKYKYDKEGRIISNSFWKNQNTKMTNFAGTHQIVSRYNENGQVIESLNLDMNGNPTKGPVNFSKEVIQYDELSRPSSRAYFDGNEATTIQQTNVSNFHKCVYIYDKNFKVKLVQYFNTDGSAIDAIVNASEFVHKIEFEYLGDKIIRQRWYTNGGVFPLVVDCVSKECMNFDGVNMGFLNK